MILQQTIIILPSLNRLFIAYVATYYVTQVSTTTFVRVVTSSSSSSVHKFSSLCIGASGSTPPDISDSSCDGSRRSLWSSVSCLTITSRETSRTYQCITEEPENFAFGPGTVGASYTYGAEYEIGGNVPSSTLPLHDQ